MAARGVMSGHGAGVMSNVVKNKGAALGLNLDEIAKKRKAESEARVASGETLERSRDPNDWNVTYRGSATGALEGGGAAMVKGLMDTKGFRSMIDAERGARKDEQTIAAGPEEDDGKWTPSFDKEGRELRDRQFGVTNQYQEELAQVLADRAMGRTQSPAEAMLLAQGQRNAAMMRGQAVSQQGMGSGLAARAGMQQGQEAQLGAQQQAGLVRMQEQAQAQGAMMQMRQLDTQIQQINDALSNTMISEGHRRDLQQALIDVEYEKTRTQRAVARMGADAQAAASSQQMTGNLIGGAMSAGGAVLGSFVGPGGTVGGATVGKLLSDQINANYQLKY